MTWITSLFKRRISLRDQFAMSAPPVPAWFEPVKPQIIPPYPDIWMLFGRNSQHPLKYLMKYYYDEENTFLDYPDEDQEQIIILEQEINETIYRFRTKKESNRMEYVIQSTSRLTHWRYFYADSMIKRTGNDFDYFTHYITEQYQIYEKLRAINSSDNTESKTPMPA